MVSSPLVGLQRLCDCLPMFMQLSKSMLFSKIFDDYCQRIESNVQTNQVAADLLSFPFQFIFWLLEAATSVWLGVNPC